MAKKVKQDSIFQNTMSNQKLGIDLVLVLVIAMPFIWVILTNVYLPVTDESYQLEAAMNLIAGHGYTASRELGFDLAQINYQYLTAWPMGYSALLALVMQVGINLNDAAILTKTIGVIISILNWYSLSKAGNLKLPCRLIFAAFLGFYVAIVATSASDLIVFAIFPFVINKLIYLKENREKLEIKSQVKYLILLGATLGVAVCFKYSALPMILIGFLMVLYIYQGKEIGVVLNRLFLYSTPAVAVISCLFISNYLAAKSISTITDIPIHKEIALFRISWLTSMASGLFVDALIIPKIIFEFLTNNVDEGISKVVENTYKVVAVVVALFVLSKRELSESWLKIVGSISAVSVILFLALTTMLFYNDTEYNPLQHGRYYQYLIPLLVLATLTTIQSSVANSSGKLIIRITVVVIISFFAVTTIKYSYYLNCIMQTEGLGSEIAKVEVSRILEEAYPNGVVVFAEGDSFHSAPWKGMYPIHYQTPERKELNFSKRTLVILICNIESSRRGLKQKNGCEESGFALLAKAEVFTEIKITSQKTLFWKVMEKNI